MASPSLSYRRAGQDEAFAKLTRLQFYADRKLAAVAAKAHGAAWSWGVYGKYDDPDDPGFHERQQRCDDAELEMLVLVRKRLAIAEGGTALPPPGYSYDKAKESGSDAE